jgi:hypothetical protein
LVAGAEGEVVCGEPVQERDGAAGEPADHLVLLPGGRAAVVAAAQAPDQVPDQVAVQEAAPLGVGLGGQQVGEEGFKADHDLVTSGQGADGDKGLPQVRQRLAGGQVVERLMGERDAAGGQGGQDRGDGRIGESPHRGDRVLGGGDVVAEGLQPGW